MLATAELGVLLPVVVAQPPVSTNRLCCHDEAFWNSASFTAASGCGLKFATQRGVSTATTAASARYRAIRWAVLPRTHPYHEKPLIIMATAPTTGPKTLV
jgi:hypothetical protein